MLAKIWRRENSQSLLEAMQISATHTDKSMQGPQETKNVIYHISGLLIFSNDIISTKQRDMYISMFFFCLFMITKLWSQSTFPSTDK